MIDPLYLHIDSSLERIDPYVQGLQFMIRRSDVRAQRVGSVVDELLKLTDDATLAERFKHRLLLSFEGYADGSHRVYNDPNYRTFVQKLNHEWPYWMHYLYPEPRAWKTILLSLAYDANDTLPDEVHVIKHVDEKTLGIELQRMADAMGCLHVNLGWEEAVSRQIFTTSMSSVRTLFRNLP